MLVISTFNYMYICTLCNPFHNNSLWFIYVLTIISIFALCFFIWLFCLSLYIKHAAFVCTGSNLGLLYLKSYAYLYDIIYKMKWTTCILLLLKLIKHFCDRHYEGKIKKEFPLFDNSVDYYLLEFNLQNISCNIASYFFQPHSDTQHGKEVYFHSFKNWTYFCSYCFIRQS